MHNPAVTLPALLRPLLAAALAAVLLAPAPAAAQTGVSVGVRAGTLGLGAEASLRVMDNLAVRGGLGVFPFEYAGDFGDVRYTVEPTSPLASIGVDYFPGFGGLRVGGGMLFFSNETTMLGEFTGTVDIGGTTYSGSDVGTLSGALDHGSMAPYVNLGLGGRGGRGLGLFLDLGAAFMSEPSLSLTASGPAAQSPQFQQDLERERRDAEEDARRYLRVWPVLSVGLRFGL